MRQGTGSFSPEADSVDRRSDDGVQVCISAWNTRAVRDSPRPWGPAVEQFLNGVQRLGVEYAEVSPVRKGLPQKAIAAFVAQGH